jgi:hypothetical protein
MLLTALAAIAASTMPPPSRSPGVSVQATASIRIISGARLSFSGEQRQPDIPPLRQTTIRTADAQQQPARLIEFQ